MTVIVVTLDGLSFGMVDVTGKALRGYAHAPGRRRVKVSYAQAASGASIREGSANLETTLRPLVDAGEEFELLAHSQGAEAVGDWLDEYAGRPDAPSPAQLRRITLIGNPERRIGGYMGYQFGKGLIGVKRKPTRETQYRTLDIARERDPFANADCWGTDKRSAAARMLARLTGFGSTHTDYSQVDIDACRVRAVSGNTRYLVAP